VQILKLYTIILFIIFGALFHGFFYELEYVLMVCTLSIILFVTLLVEKKLQFHPFHILLFLFVISYWAAILYAQDHELALEEALKVTPIVLIALLAAGLNLEQKLKILKVCIWAGSGIVVIGVLFHLYRQNRLESTIEYANTMAILLLFAGILSILFYLKEKKPYHLLNLTLQIGGLLLTLSRSVWILWIGAIVLLLWTYKLLRSKKLLLKLGLAHLAALVLAIVVKWDVFFFLNRVHSIQAKASELQVRLVYWHDSMAMIRDHWLLGTGGGGWSVLLAEYSNPIYYVKYVHNQYLQIFMDVGLIGMAFFIALIVVFYIRTWGQIKTNGESKFWMQGAAIAVTFLLLHAGFDFDLSFPLLLGILSFTMNITPTEISIKPIAKNVLFLPSLISLIALILFTGWLTIGYSFKQNGEQAINAKTDLDKAQQQFTKAEWFMPWSSRVHYDAAKGFVLLGNQLNNASYYKEAIIEINKAIQLSPKQALYKSLQKDLEK
jgi:O-antigen ligase